MNRFGDMIAKQAPTEPGLIQGSAYKPRTLRENLLDQKAAMETRMKEIDEALALLDRNPDFEKLQDLLSR